MLKILMGTDWKMNTDAVMAMLSRDVAQEQGNRILIVPESISHDAERRLCKSCGDTASRFAEVLSFTRLAGRVQESVGSGSGACMDNAGRVVVMAAAAVQLHSCLKAYAAVETRPEFLMSLVEALDEFKRCCIQPKDLRFASKHTQGSLAQKLEELALLFDAYDSICQQGKRDPSDQLTWLLEQLEDSDFAQQHTFYFDGFSDFTGQQMAIVKHLLQTAPLVVISLTCDRPSSAASAFVKAGETASQLLLSAKEAGVEVNIENIAVQISWHSCVCSALFDGGMQASPEIEEHLQVCQCSSLADECDFAAERVLALVRAGNRYRDIHIVCTNMDIYRSALHLAFSRRDIPVYMSGTEDILDMPVIHTVLTALEAACGGFEQQTVIRYLRSALSPIDLDTCDLLENYAIMWNIRGSRWINTWVNHPDGLGADMDEQAQARLRVLNEARQTALLPLIRLSKSLAEAQLLNQQIVALYAFLEDISMAARLEQIASRVQQEQESADVQMLNQLWEILLSALEQLHDVLGHSAWSCEAFVRLLKLLLSQYDIGTIPPVLDAVSAGSVAAGRSQMQKHLIVLGAQEGALPNYGGSKGVLTDTERTALRQMGVPLTGGALDSLQSEFADIHNIFSGAQESIWVCCPCAQTSFVYRRLAALAGNEIHLERQWSAALSSQSESSALLVRYLLEDVSLRLDVGSTYSALAERAGYQLGKVQPENLQTTYGKKLNLSASQVDKLADCRFAYFLKYGLRAKECKEATVDPAEFGTYVHAVLEQTGRKIQALGGFKNVTLEQTLQIADGYSEAYALDRFSQLDSKRLSYLFVRNAQELKLIVTELWEEFQDSQFEPVDFELGFGDEADMPAITVPGAKIPAQLRGFVDRVDVWKENGQNYFRVVDYKTGKKDFDYCDVFNGLGLQMLLYLFALEDAGDKIVGTHPVPSGVQYFPARVPLIKADGKLTQEEAGKQRGKLWKRKGLILGEEQVLRAMETTETPIRTGYTRKKDGQIGGDIADRTQMRLLKRYIFALLKSMVDYIASGCVDPNPYTRGESHSACRFCPYGAVCHPEQVDGRRNYKAMSSQQFWEQIGKEMQANG